MKYFVKIKNIPKITSSPRKYQFSQTYVISSDRKLFAEVVYFFVFFLNCNEKPI